MSFLSLLVFALHSVQAVETNCSETRASLNEEGLKINSSQFLSLDRSTWEV